MLKLADYLYSTPDIQWRYAAQMGIRNAVGRMPDGHMEEVAESYEKLKAMRDLYEENGFRLAVIEPACPNQKIKRNLPGRDEEIERMITLIRNMGNWGSKPFAITLRHILTGFALAIKFRNAAVRW